MISVLSAVAEIERENIRTQTMAGREQKAREGKWNGGFAPYGLSLIHIWTDDGYILNGIVQGRHPGIAFRDGKLRREIAAEHFCKTLCGCLLYTSRCV